MSSIYPGDKIIVLGCPGSGKSTFAEKLATRTGLPLFHLDNIWWMADRTNIGRDAFDRELDRLLQAGKWIIDGDYSRTYEIRIRACDTVIFLDCSEETCLGGVLGRVGQERPDIPWVEQQPDPELLELVRNYRSVNRPKLLALLAKYPEKQTLIFRTRAEADGWLSGMPAMQDAGPESF